MNYNDIFNYDYSLQSRLPDMLAVYLIIIALLFIFYVITYIFKGIGMYTIGKRLGMASPWLAFIPFARTYFHGELAGQIKLKNKSIKNPGIGLLAMPFLLVGITIVFYIIFILVGFAGMVSSAFSSHGLVEPGLNSGAILGMIVVGGIWMIATLIYEAVYCVLQVLVNYQIFAKFTSSNMSIAHGVLCSVLPLYEAFSLFIFRNKKFNPGMEPDIEATFCQPGAPVVPTMPIMPETQGEKAENPEAEKKYTEQEPPSVVIPPATQGETLEQKPEEQKLEEQKPEEQKLEEKKPEEQKPEEQKPEEQKPEEQKSEEKDLHKSESDS